MSGLPLQKPSMDKEAIHQPESGPELFHEKDTGLSDDLSLTSSQTTDDKELLERPEGVAIKVT